MKVDGSLWIDINGLGAAGHGRIRLLEFIAETGSIKKAAEAVGISYKTAWDSINSLNTVFGSDLVERKTGGKGGVGTSLTNAGLELVKTYNYYSRIHEIYLSDISQLNRLEAIITELNEGYAVAETASGDKLACVLMDEGIKIGGRVSLFIKPSDIILITSKDFEASARNILKTCVTDVKNDGKTAEIALSTEKGTALKVRITSESASKLSLKTGRNIYALFKTASVLAAAI
jgi:molybdate transport system regulatory protein